MEVVALIFCLASLALFVLLCYNLRTKGIIVESLWIFWFYFLLVLNYSLKGIFAAIIVVPLQFRPAHTHFVGPEFMILATIVANLAIILSLLIVINKWKWFAGVMLRPVKDPISLSLKILILFEIFLYIYIIVTGKFYGLRRETSLSIIDLYLYGLHTLIYPAFYIALSYYLSHKKKVWLFVVLSMVTLVVLHSLMNATKVGIVLIFVVFYIALKIHRIRIKLVYWSIGLISVLAIFTYTYFARFNFDVYSSGVAPELVLLQLRDSFESLEWKKILLYPLFTRLELLDNLAVVIAHSPIQNLGWFRFGSIVEVLNLIPRLIWNDRPFLQFNYFTVSSIYGSDKMWSSSVGRIGESYIVFGYMSVFTYLFYLFLFQISAINIIKKIRDKNLMQLVLMHFILIYCLRDDYFLQSFIGILFAVVFIIAIKVLTKLIK